MLQEITAGDANKNTIRVDLWWRDGNTPWGSSEISTFVRRGQSIGLQGQYEGTAFAYPMNGTGDRWTHVDAACEAAAHLNRRITQGNNVVNVIYIRLQPHQYILATYDAISGKVVLSKPIWQGDGDQRDDGLIGIRGFVPLKALLDLRLASSR